MSKQSIVVVVDDDPGMSRAMARMIELTGMTPVTYGSAEAMLAERRDGVECVVIDVQLPGMDGFQLHEQLVARGHEAPVIFVSALEEAEARVHALPGARAFLAKPFSGLMLLETVKRLLSEAA